MNLSESYKKRIQELAGVYENFTPEEYNAQLRKLGIDNFEDLEGRTVGFIKPSYGEHKVLKWYPERKEYLLFTDGQKVLGNPFNVFLIPEKTEKETEIELKWVITNICEKKVKNIEIKNYNVNENAELIVTFNITIEDFSQVPNIKEKTIILYSDVVLKLFIKEKELKYHLEKIGAEKFLSGNIYTRWSEDSPFTKPNYGTTDIDWKYMKTIVEHLILEKI
jgi:hypothetical protein